MQDLLRSSTIIKYIFNTFIFSKRSLHKKLLNIYLIEVEDRNNCPKGFKIFSSMLFCFNCTKDRNAYGERLFFCIFMIKWLGEIHFCSLDCSLEANQNKNNCLVSNFYNKLKFPALFSVRNRWKKSAGDYSLL